MLWGPVSGNWFWVCSAKHPFPDQAIWRSLSHKCCWGNLGACLQSGSLQSRAAGFGFVPPHTHPCFGVWGLQSEGLQSGLGAYKLGQPILATYQCFRIRGLTFLGPTVWGPTVSVLPHTHATVWGVWGNRFWILPHAHEAYSLGQPNLDLFYHTPEQHSGSLQSWATDVGSVLPHTRATVWSPGVWSPTVSDNQFWICPTTHPCNRRDVEDPLR